MEWATSFSVDFGSLLRFFFLSAAGAEKHRGREKCGSYFFPVLFHKNLPDFDTVSICGQGEMVQESRESMSFSMSVFFI